MRIIVCGGRGYVNEPRVWDILGEYLDRRPHIITGGARGADYLADRFARMHNLARSVYPAQWSTHGNAAGVLRNEEMAQAGADLCIAFPGGRGTQDMVCRAANHGIEVRVVDPQPDPAVLTCPQGGCTAPCSQYRPGCPLYA